MKALLVLAHGSRKKESNDEVMSLAQELDSSGHSGYDRVLCAFNQFSAPSAESQIEALAAMGATRITVLPYFIAGGSHVVSDIPELVKEAESRHPGIAFRVTAHFGAFRGVKELIVRELSEVDRDI